MVESLQAFPKEIEQLVKQTDEQQADDAEYFYNKEFVKQIMQMKAYEEAGSFIAKWIKVQKHNATEFTSDLPALLEKACEKRKKLLIAHEENETIFSKPLEGSEHDYIMHQTLNLLEACSLNELVPGIISRILLNNLYIQIQEEELILTAEHQELAFSKVKNVRTELIFDFVSKLKLQDRVDEAFFLQLAKDHYQANRFNEAALIIHKFKFTEHFDCVLIIKKLVDSNKIPAAKQLCELDDNFKIHLIKLLSTNDNAKIGAKIVSEFKLDINDFPELKERLLKSSMRYYLSRYLYKKPSDDDYMSLYRIEDLFSGFKPMLAYLVDDLVWKNKMNEAKGVCLRHDLALTIREDVREKLADVIYDDTKDIFPQDAFGPVSKGNYLALPSSVKVEFVSTEEDVEKLSYLLTQKYIGVDSEWRPSIAKFHKTGIGLFQISGQEVAFLVDMISLKDSEKLDSKLTEIFSNEKSVVVGFSFNSDIDQFVRKLPKMRFYKFIRNFIDAQYFFSVVYKTGPMTGLAKVSEAVFGNPICKNEQMSNWERRPLRQSQQHYAAFDAYILVDIIQRLSKEGQEKGIEMEKYVNTLDNRHYISNANNSSEEEGSKFLDQKPDTKYSGEHQGKKKNFGASTDDKKKKDFIPSPELKPEMKSQGFIVDKNLMKIGQMLQSKGVDCKMEEGVDSDQICQIAIKENRVFLTSNLKLFNKKLAMPRGCLHFKANPFNQFKALQEFFQF